MERLLIRLEKLLLQRLPTGVLTDELIREGLLPEAGWEALEAMGQPPEAEICARVVALLGHGDAESQAASVRLAAEELREVTEKASREEAEKGKLYPTLGLMLGMLAAVMSL